MNKTYQYHKPSLDGLAKVQQLRDNFSFLHDLVVQIAPASRERSIALTELENAVMWAIKSVVINDPDSVVEE